MHHPPTPWFSCLIILVVLVIEVEWITYAKPRSWRLRVDATYAHHMSTSDPTSITPSEPPVLDAEAALHELNRLFESALKRLGDAGQTDEACTLAADGWKLLRHGWPKEGERLNGTLHYLTRQPKQARPSSAEDYDLDVRHLIPAERHRVIFEKWYELAPGAGYVLVNDHDPRPLYYQFAAEHAGAFTWDAIEEGPVVWRVRIGRTPAG